MHRGLREALDEHAYLQQHGIREPTGWHPPTDIAPPNLAKPPIIDVSLLHTMTRSSIPLRRIAKDPGTSLAQAGIVFEAHPLPS